MGRPQLRNLDVNADLESGTPWRRFFDSPVDPRVYTVFRIVLSIVLLVHLLVLGRDWIRWFGEDGVLPLEVSRGLIDEDTVTLFQWIPGDTRTLWIVYGIILFQVVALGLGWFTRFQTVSLFVWMVSLHHRNNLLWEGEDVLLRIILFLAIFMPLGAVGSVDAFLRGRRNRGGEERGTSPFVSAWPLRVLQVELSLLYFSAAIGKLQGRTWQDGSALHYVLRLDEFSGDRLPIPHFLLASPGICQWLTWVAVAIEVLLIFGVWLPSIRRQCVLVGVGFHLLLELTMNLFLFQWLMILVLLTHLVTPLPSRRPKRDDPGEKRTAARSLDA